MYLCLYIYVFLYVYIEIYIYKYKGGVMGYIYVYIYPKKLQFAAYGQFVLVLDIKCKQWSCSKRDAIYQV